MQLASNQGANISNTCSKDLVFACCNRHEEVVANLDTTKVGYKYTNGFTMNILYNLNDTIDVCIQIMI